MDTDKLLLQSLGAAAEVLRGDNQLFFVGRVSAYDPMSLELRVDLHRGRETPQGVLSVCGLPGRTLPEQLTGRRYVVLDGVQDPGNVGTILRTADAFHADGLFLVNACADLYNPKTVRASMGAVFRCPVWTCGLEELRALLTKSGLPLYGAALRSDTVDVRRADFSHCAVAVGSEGKGLSAACDLTVRIPMSGHCESLNAAAAAAVLLWEAARDD